MKKKSKAWREAKARRNRYRRDWAETIVYDRKYGHQNPHRSLAVRIVEKIKKWAKR